MNNKKLITNSPAIFNALCWKTPKINAAEVINIYLALFYKDSTKQRHVYGQADVDSLLV